MTLINAIFDALPVYWMTLFRMPKSIVANIELSKGDSIGERLIILQTSITKKLYTVNGDLICTSKCKGGMGIKNIELKNNALLANWWWRAKIEQGSLGYRVLKIKYVNDFLYNPKSQKNTISSIMKSISDVESNKELKLFEELDFSWKLGDGATIQFWNYCWYQNIILKWKFSRLYDLFLDKEISVQDMIQR